MNNIMNITCEARLIGSVDVSDPKNALKEVRRVSRVFPDLVTLGNSRNYVTFREGEVRSVVFYDCFWELPETSEELAVRSMINAICEEAALSARLVCRTYHEYVVAVNNCALREVDVLRSTSM